MDYPLLRHILSLPTAPFCESHVVAFLRAYLSKEGIPHFLDPIGNIVVGADSKKEYQRKIAMASTEPVRLFIAHMDHPGFHGLEWQGPNTLKAKWLGGTPRKYLSGSTVWFSAPCEEGNQRSPFLGWGRVKKPQLNAAHSALESSEIQIASWEGSFCKDDFDAQKIFGGFSFRSPVWQSKKKIYSKAADDLVGVFALVSLAKRLKKKRTPFLGLLSRAEEVGFIGTIAHLDLGWIPQHRDRIVAVSLETSRTLPGAVIGKGPIVRIGDRATPFDPGLLQVLTQVAEKRLSGRYQKRIMDGGTCEATAATAFGLRSMGISVPLGNYHNQSFEGGPDSRGHLGPAPEFVHEDDIAGMMELCEGLMETRLPWTDPWEPKRLQLIRSKQSYQSLLKALK